MYFRTRLVISVISAISVISVISVRSTSAAALRTRPRYETPRYETPRPQSSDTANLYRVNCQMCHGPNGKALIPEMAFVGRKWKHGTKSSDMAKIIAEGVKGTPMMPFKSKLTEAQIKALARYVRAFDKTLPPEKK
jgi:mono/diheme cytochrome c family protein